MLYIRQRENGNWQCRIYSNNTKFSFTSPDLDEVIKRRNAELGFNPDEEKREPKILIFDIETSPILAWVWGVYQQFISPEHIEEDKYILCYGYKWLNQETKFLSLVDFPNYKQKNDNEKLLLESLWCLFDEADIIVAHNGIYFDIKEVNGRFFYYGLPEPSPYKIVDTLKIAKKNFRFTSNKLDYLSKYKGHGGKLDNEGMSLWVKCIKGDLMAWKDMKKYNIVDIDKLEEIYLELRPWDKSHPNLAHYYNDNLTRCTNCGSEKVIPLNEDIPTTTQTYPLYKCEDCGHYMRGRKNNTTKDKEILTTAR